MSIEEKRREAFEAWALSQGMNIKSDLTVFDYAYSRTENAWRIWNAALDSVEIELPQPWTEAFMKSESMLQDCKFAIEACGLKVKV